MRKFELIFLVAPDTPEEKQVEFCERLRGYVTQMKGTLIGLNLWEKRRMAYEIKKFREAFYYVMQFEGDGKLVDELERRMRVADEVIRFLTIRVDEAEKLAEKRRTYYTRKREGLEKRKKREPQSSDRQDGPPHRDRDRRPRYDNNEVRNNE